MRIPNQLPAREIAATCPPGLEAVVLRELSDLGWPKPRQTTGIITCVGGSEALFRACLGCRTATDLRVRVGRLKATSLEGLAQGLAKLQWPLFVHPGQQVTVRVSSRASRLKRKDAVARKAVLAIRDAVRGPRIDHRPGRHRNLPPLIVHLRIEESKVEASVDPVGESLWKRGYRSRGGAAPLRENLAAAALLAMGWRVPQPLVDPFCGSGTLLIEGAAMAAGRAPGAKRRFAMEQWPCHATRLWRQIRGGAQGGRGGARPVILGADADAAVLGIAEDNARRAGVAASLRWAHQRVDALQPPAPGPGLVLSNPPWGQRLGDRVRGVYRALGQRLLADFPGWQLGLLCPDRRLIKAVGFPLQPQLDFAHAGARLILWGGTVPGPGAPPHR